MKLIKQWIHRRVMYHRWKVIGKHLDLDGIWNDRDGFPFSDYWYTAESETLLYRIRDRIRQRKYTKPYHKWLKNPENQARTDRLMKGIHY